MGEVEDAGAALGNLRKLPGRFGRFGLGWVPPGGYVSILLYQVVEILCFLCMLVMMTPLRITHHIKEGGLPSSETLKRTCSKNM